MPYSTSKNRRKYSDEQIRAAAAESLTIREAMLRLGMPDSGGSRQHLKLRFEQASIDTSHFLGNKFRTGQSAHNRKAVETHLTRRPSGSSRLKASVLRGAMIEYGFVYQCAVDGCSISGMWLSKPITLEINHIDGDWLNNDPRNLEFLCPNCHSQEPTSTSWKNAERSGTSTICACGGRKQHTSKTCASCYHSSRRK